VSVQLFMTRLTVAVIFVASAAWAQQPKKVQEIKFGPEEIEGRRKAPDVSHIVANKPPPFGNLIKVRDNFADKIMKSVDQM
jgi:hypothetical protein